MINPNRSSLIIGSLLSTVLLGGCVWQSDYDKLQMRYTQLQQQSEAQDAANKAEIARLQGAIKYTVNSDLLFPSGGWQLSNQGKSAIAKIASQLAPTQQNHIVVNGYTDNAPIGPGLKQQGITTNTELSQKRADAVMQYMISQGVKPDLISAKGYGEQNPVATNATAAGRAQNRRVEMTLAGG